MASNAADATPTWTTPKSVTSDRKAFCVTQHKGAEFFFFMKCIVHNMETEKSEINHGRDIVTIDASKNPISTAQRTWSTSDGLRVNVQNQKCYDNSPFVGLAKSSVRE
eukprot:gb/GECG01012446.1/.p1 GENE.gb/GECG01012446.1/~~gb/GECG01012446.1/.p1  ORF type:complete len:108 (+),score=6.89 gb/GECG01012446.1/:1-324(+)